MRALTAPLPGPLRTVDGAELLSSYAILRHSVAPTTAKFDASYVVKGVLERGAGDGYDGSDLSMGIALATDLEAPRRLRGPR